MAAVVPGDNVYEALVDTEVSDPADKAVEDEAHSVDHDLGRLGGLDRDDPNHLHRHAHPLEQPA
jgi:hypothetical protein